MLMGESCPLAIGAILGGANAANRPWMEAITDISRRVEPLRTGVASPLCISVLFHVPGHVLQPEFQGVRTGPYSKKRGQLTVQVAVPATAPSDARADVQAMLAQAIDEAELWARKRGIAPDLNAIRGIVDRLAGFERGA
jgi:hypothetical protein